MGNPIGFKRSMTRILNKTSGDSGAKKMIKRNKKNLSLIRVNSKSIFKDFNTQKDFLLNQLTIQPPAMGGIIAILCSLEIK